MSDKDLRSLQKQRELEEKIEKTVGAIGGGIKNIFRMKTKREKVIKGSLAAIFATVSIPYAVSEISENEMVPMTVMEKQKIENISCSRVVERYKSSKKLEKGQVFRGKIIEKDSSILVDEIVEKTGKCTTDIKYLFKMNDGQIYELETGFLQGVNSKKLEKLWNTIKDGSEGYFTTSKTITGKRIITDYSKNKP